jgi:hypothetical protein
MIRMAWIRLSGQTVLICLALLLTAGFDWAQEDSSREEAEKADSVKSAPYGYHPDSSWVEVHKATGGEWFTFRSDGPRSDEEIQEVVSRYYNVLNTYYHRELKANPVLKGTLKIRLTIKPNGTVATATVLENSVGSSKLAWSIQQHCLRWQFKPVAEGMHTLDLSFPFEPT